MSGDIVFGIRIKGDAKDLVGEVKVSREEFRKLASDAKSAGEAVSGGFSTAAKGVRSISGQLDEFRSVMKGIGAGSGIYVLYQQFKQIALGIVEAQASADKLRNSLTFATGSQRGAAADIEYLRKVTNTLGLEFGSAATAYAKLSASAQGTAVSHRQVRDIFESVAKASTVMGLSAEETNGALLAISQMMSKGTVQAEELRGQLGERLPGAFNIAARAMGKSTAELGKMLEQGQVISSDFLPKFAAELTRTLGDAPEKAANSAQAAMNRMTGAWQQAKQAFADTGAGGAVVALLSGAATSMQRFADGVAAAKQAGWNGWSQFWNGTGAMVAGAAGAATSIDEKKAQLVRRIFEIQNERKRMLQFDDAYIQNMQGPGLDAEEAAARQELDALSRRGKIRIDLAKDFATQEAQTKAHRNELLKQLDTDLAKFDENLGKKQQIDGLKEKYKELKESDPAKFDQLINAARQKLYGKQGQAARLEELDAEQGVERQKLKAHLDDLAMLQKTGQISQLEEIRRGADARLVELDKEIAIEQQKKAAAPRDPAEQARAAGRIAELRAEKETISRQAANDATELQRAQTLALDQWRLSEADALDQMQFEALLIGKSREEQERLTNARRIDLAVRNATRNADGSRKVEADVEAEYQAAAEAAKKSYEERLSARTHYEESWVAGAKRALASYMDEIRNFSSGAGRLFEVSARGAENAWVKFFTTGKLEARDWGNAIMEEIARIYYQKNIARAATSIIDMGVSAVGQMFGFGGQAPAPVFDAVPTPVPGRASGGRVTRGSLYEVNERGPELLQEGGKTYLMMGARSGSVIPNSALSGAGTAAPVLNITILNEAGDVAQASVSGGRQNSSGGMDVDVLVARAMTSDIGRNGPMTQALSRRFGLNGKTY